MQRATLAVSTAVLAIVFTLSLTGCDMFKPRPPVAEQRAVSDTLFGDVRTDPYHWLRDREDPEVIAYLEAENAYTDAMMKGTEELQQSLYDEMVERLDETDESVPVRDGSWYYSSRTEEGKDYKIYVRTPVRGGREQVYLNHNELAEGHDYHELGHRLVSPDHSLLAFSEDTTGRETYTLRFKDLESGELLEDKIDSVYYSGAWANDNRTFFYVTLDAALRPFRVWRHRLGTPASEDVMVYEEKDERFWVSLGKSRDDRFVFVKTGAKLTSEVLFLPAWVPEASFRPVLERVEGVEYSVGHRKGFFYLLTNADGAENFKLVKLRTNSLADPVLTEVVGHREDVLLHGFELFENHLVLSERKDAAKRIRIHTFAPVSDHFVELPEEVYAVWTGSNPMFDTDSLRLVYSSFITPKTVFDYSVPDRRLVRRKQDEVGGGYDPSRYTVKRLMAPARDGELIPVSMVQPVDAPQDGSAPLLLYGYGSYGATIDPGFRAYRISLLERGFSYAVAHVRGSQARGRRWYDEGKFLQKKNTFNDFVDVAEYLVRRRFTSPEKLVARGGSAGGLLMGAIANQRPDLFEVIVAHVPFVDVLNTMLDETIPLTVTEFEEWGNPKQEEYYWYMKEYAPYENVREREYPHMLITAGLNDPRVQYWEPAKWTAKLRAMNAGDSDILLKTHMGAGHGGASGRYGYLEERAFEYAFVLTHLNLD